MQSNTTNIGKRCKVMTPEQFSQVVEAISQGRYSWACVLILRFVGYNPLHFIPYRTYNRLVKENRLLDTATEPADQRKVNQPFPVAHSAQSPASKRQPQINDLTHIETLDRQDDLYGGAVVLTIDHLEEHFVSQLESLGDRQSTEWNWHWKCESTINLN